MNDRTTWTAVCRAYHDIKGDAHAYGFGTRWRLLVEATRVGSATPSEWDALVEDIEARADDESNFISKGNADERRAAALRAAAGDYVCAAGLCDRSAPEERADRVPVCLLLDRPMTPSRDGAGHESAR